LESSVEEEGIGWELEWIGGRLERGWETWKMEGVRMIGGRFDESLMRVSEDLGKVRS
jgi:hypothetical protein